MADLPEARRTPHEMATAIIEAGWGAGARDAQEFIRLNSTALAMHDSAVAVVARLLEEGGSVAMSAAEHLTREAKAAQASFAEDHSLGARSWGRGRHGSIPKTHGAEGRNWLD